MFPCNSPLQSAASKCWKQIKISKLSQHACFDAFSDVLVCFERIIAFCVIFDKLFVFMGNNRFGCFINGTFCLGNAQNNFGQTLEVTTSQIYTHLEKSALKISKILSRSNIIILSTQVFVQRTPGEEGLENPRKAGRFFRPVARLEHFLREWFFLGGGD